MSALDSSPCWDADRRRAGETAFSAVDAITRRARHCAGRWAIALAAALFATAGPASSQGLIPIPYSGDELVPQPDVDVWLRQIRNDKLDLILHGAMREHGIDMWIHVARAGDSPGLYIDLHAMRNNGGDLVTLGPSIAPFRRDRDDFIMHPNHIFAFEYALHLKVPAPPGYPVSINFSNPQVLTTNGVEWIQDPNY